MVVDHLKVKKLKDEVMEPRLNINSTNMYCFCTIYTNEEARTKTSDPEWYTN